MSICKHAGFQQLCKIFCINIKGTGVEKKDWDSLNRKVRKAKIQQLVSARTSRGCTSLENLQGKKKDRITSKFFFLMIFLKCTYSGISNHSIFPEENKLFKSVNPTKMGRSYPVNFSKGHLKHFSYFWNMLMKKWAFVPWHRDSLGVCTWSHTFQ